jgi:hypothetical protein
MIILISYYKWHIVIQSQVCHAEELSARCSLRRKASLLRKLEGSSFKQWDSSLHCVPLRMTRWCCHPPMPSLKAMASILIIFHFTFITTNVTSSSGAWSPFQFLPSFFRNVIISSGAFSATSSKPLRMRL